MERLIVLFISISFVTIGHVEAHENRAINVSYGKGMSAVEFNDSIISLQMNIIAPTLELMSLESEDILGDLDKVIILTKRNISVLEAMKIFKGGEAMHAAALDLFNFYLRTKRCRGHGKKPLRCLLKRVVP